MPPTTFSIRLFPVRDGKRLGDGKMHLNEGVLGRRELLQCYVNACGCRRRCRSCRNVWRWAIKGLSRKMVRIERGELRVRGMNAVNIVRVNYNKLGLDCSDVNAWSGSVRLCPGAILTFVDENRLHAPLEFEAVLVETKEEKIIPFTILDPPTITPEPSTQSQQLMEFDATQPIGGMFHDCETTPLFQTSQPSQTGSGALCHQMDETTPCSEQNLVPPTQRVTQAHGGSGALSPPIENTPDLFQQIAERIDQEVRDWEESIQENKKETDGVPFPKKVHFSQPLTQSQEEIQTTTKANLESNVKCPTKDVEIIKVDKTTTQEKGNIDATIKAEPQAPTRGQPQEEAKEKKKTEERPVLFFIQMGRGLPLARIRILSDLARRKGALVVEDFNGQLKPTHLVIDAQVNVVAVAKHLGFRSPPQLANEVNERGIETVKPEWIVKSREKLLKPRMDELWNGLLNVFPKKRRRQNQDDAQRTARQKVDNAGGGSCDSPTRPQEIPRTGSQPTRNLALSKMFEELSKLYNSAPLQKSDEFKANQFSLVAGRLRHLDFEIANDRLAVAKLKRVKNVGATAVEMIRDFLQTGNNMRIQGLKTDPDRVAMRALMGIWGIGKSTAADLLNLGFRNITQIREGLKSRALVFDRNQMVGVECYEDFQEKIGRAEVEAIGAIVKAVVQERLPNAEVTIMGSYRRRKAECGDVDVLITEPSFVKETPKQFVDELVTRLMKRGHIAYHLTKVEGMDQPQESSQSSSETVPPADAGVEHHPTSQTYMGVFFSPSVTGKRRRIDIKFYPYREKAFASLYFTGSGWFNRSMRLWAKRAKKLCLNDHGLFPLGDKHSSPKPSERLLMEAATEEQVFGLLGLVYKEPHERQCFDDVMGRDGVPSVNFEPTKPEVYSDKDQHCWVD